MARAEGIGVTRLQNPAEISIRRRPEHEVSHDLGSNSIRYSAAADRMYPHRPYAGLKLHSWRKIKRLLSENFSPCRSSTDKRHISTPADASSMTLSRPKASKIRLPAV